MNKCTWCGKEYPEGTVTCPTDGTSLESSAPIPIAASTNAIPLETPTAPATSPDTKERRLRFIEIATVMGVAFGGSVLVSAFRFFGADIGSGGYVVRWTHSMLHALCCLGLVWYLLAQRGKSFSDLGLVCGLKDIGWSVLLYLGGGMSFAVAYSVLKWAGLTSTTVSAASGHVAANLFGGVVPVVALIYQLINPFFEEILVRGYLMTEIQGITRSVWKAVTVSTLFQMSYHFYQGAPMALSEGVLFLIFSIYYARTHRLAPARCAKTNCYPRG